MGDGLEFADHRDYASGDDIRFVDWPFYARMEKLLLRMFHEHSESDVAIMLDASASMAPGGNPEKFDHARRLAAALAFVAMGSMERVIMLPFADKLSPALRTGRNKSHILSVLEFLDQVQPGGPTDLGACCRQLVREYPSAGIVLLAGDLMNSREQLSDALAWLKTGRRDVIVLQTYAAWEVQPALSGPTLLQWAEGPGRLNLDISEPLLEQYRRSWLESQEAIRHTCIARAVTYVAAPTDVPMEELILQSLRKAGVLRE
jgi:uncharacterized protein (DUF58 family)